MKKNSTLSAAVAARMLEEIRIRLVFLFFAPALSAQTITLTTKPN